MLPCRHPALQAAQVQRHPTLSNTHLPMKRLAALVTFLVALAACSSSHAQSPVQKIAILSLVGEFITIETYRQRTGTLVDANARETFAIPDPFFDHAALLAAQEATEKIRPGAALTLLGVPKPGSASDPAQLLDGDKLQTSSPLMAALKRENFTHLLTITKLRAPARMKLANGTVGSGYLTGLGFYVDKEFLTMDEDTLKSARGFIAPYAYLKLSLIDVAAGSVLNQREVMQSTVQSAANSDKSFDAWEAMTTEQKFTMLRNLIAVGVKEAVPAVFGAR
jgi:hypothetical protein